MIFAKMGADTGSTAETPDAAGPDTAPDTPASRPTDADPAVSVVETRDDSRASDRADLSDVAAVPK